MRFGLDRLMGIGTAALAAAACDGGCRRARAIARTLVCWRDDALSRRDRLRAAVDHGRRAHPFPDRAGTASSVMGLVQQSGAAIAAAAVGAISATRPGRSPRWLR